LRFKRVKHEHEAGFDLTAMADIVLMLIIFFTFTTR